MRKSAFILLFITAFICTISIAQANDIERQFIDEGLIDVNSIDDSIKVDLVNSNPQNNYFRENYYGGLSKAYLRSEVAIKLSKAQKILQQNEPGYSLLILDAARPRHVSILMFEKMKGTRFEKYVANPEKGSMHNYGVSVDVSIVDKAGREIDMGYSPFRKSTVEIYWNYLKSKLGFKLTGEQEKNRKLLNRTMVSAGFIPLAFEWWHFDGMTKAEAGKRYKVIE